MPNIPAWQKRENKRLQKQLGLKQKDFEKLQQDASRAGVRVTEYLAAQSAAAPAETGAITTRRGAGEDYRAIKKDMEAQQFDRFETPPPPKGILRGVEAKLQRDDIAEYYRTNDRYWETDEFKKWALIRIGHPEIVPASSPQPNPPPPSTMKLKGGAQGVSPQKVIGRDESGLITVPRGKEIQNAPTIAPRYTFVKGFTGEEIPFYSQAYREAEFAAMEEAAKGKPWLVKATTWFAIKMGRLGDSMYKNFVTIGGQTEEELLTQDDPTKIGNAAFEWLFNVGAAAVEGISYMMYDIGVKSQHAEIEKLRDKIATMPDGPERRKEILHLQGMEEFERGFDKARQEWEEAKQSVMRSWEKAQNAKFALADLEQEAKEKGISVMELRKQKEAAALVDSQNYTTNALTEYNLARSTAATDETLAKYHFEKAVDFQRQAIEARRRSDPYDSFGAATWSREPTRYDAFMNNAASLELQFGRPLTTPEIRRLKDYYTNVWTELSFQMVFDFTNLIPFVGPFAGAVGDAAKKVPFVGKFLNWTGDVRKAALSAPVVSILTRDSVSTVADRINRIIRNNFGKMAIVYNSSDEFLADLPKLAGAINEARGVTKDQALLIFKQLGEQMRGANQIDFDTFKHMVDMADVSKVDPATWAGKMEEGVKAAEQVYKDRALAKAAKEGVTLTPAQLEQEAIAAAQNTKQLGIALEFFGGHLADTYVDSHRIYEGGKLLDDSIAGTIQKYARMFAADTIDMIEKNPNYLLPSHILPKDASFEEKLAHKLAVNFASAGVHSPKVIKKLVKATFSEFPEWMAQTGQLIRDMWSVFVLSTPRWVTTNLIDSTGRSMVYGGNPFDDLFTLMSSTQSHFLDDVGFHPVEFGQALANTNLPFHERIPIRLLYEDYKPKWGLLSYWGDEWKRLNREAKTIGSEALKGADMNSEFARTIAAKMGDQSKWYKALWNGVATLPGAYAGGISNFNTAIEFTLRTRMFHREYFTLLKRLEPEFATKGMEALSPVTRSIAARIWKASEGSPAKLQALVDSVVKGASVDSKAAWAMILPENWDDVLKMVNPNDAAAFTYHVRTEMNAFFESTLKFKGRMPDATEIKAFMKDMKTEMQNVVQMQIANANTYRQAGGIIDPSKVGSPLPDITDLNGSAPKVGPQVNEDLVKAARSITPKMRAKTMASRFGEAVSPYGQVRRVPGSSDIKVTKEGNDLVISIGEGFDKLPREQAQKAIKDAAVDIMSSRDEQFIKAQKLFKDMDDYKSRVRLMLDNPTELLNQNKQQFHTIFHQINTNPQLADIFEGLGRGTKSRIESALDVFLKSEHREVTVEKMLDYEVQKKIMQQLRDDVLDRHPDIKRNVPIYNAASHDFFEQARGMNDPELFAAVSRYADLHGQMMSEWSEFLNMFVTRPLTKRGGERAAAWQAKGAAIAQMYANEAQLRQTVTQLMKTNRDEALRLLQESIDIAPDKFLSKVGVELTKDELGNIMKVKILGTTYSARHPFSPIIAIQARFFNRPRDIGIAGTAFSARDRAGVRSALKQVFSGMTNEQADAAARVFENHARWHAKLTGESVEDYLSKLSFAKADGIYQLNDKDVIIRRGAFRYLENEDRFVLFGMNEADFPTAMREASMVFYADLVAVAEKNTDMADALARIQSHIANVSGETFTPGKTTMTKKQAEKFSDIFINYMQTGEMDMLRMKKPMEKFKDWLAEAFEGIKDTRAAEEIPQDVYEAMSQIFIRKQLKPQKTTKRAARLIASELGFKDATPDDILKIVNSAKGTVKLPPPQDVDVIDDVAYQSFKTSKPGQALAEWIGGGASGAEKKKLVEALDAHPEIVRQWKSNARAALDEAYPDQDYVDLTIKVTGQPKWRAYDSLSELEEGVRGYQGVPLRVRVPKENILTTYRENPVMYRGLSSEKEVLLNERGYFGAELLNEPEGSAYLESFRKAQAEFKEPVVMNTYGDLADVPLKEIEDAINAVKGTAKKSRLTESMNEAWEVWKTRRDFFGFSDEMTYVGQKFYPLRSPDDMKAFLRKMIDEEPQAIAEVAERQLYLVEQFQGDFTKAISQFNDELRILDGELNLVPTSVNWEEKLFPTIHNYQMNDGVKTAFASMSYNENNYVAALKALDELEDWLTTGKWAIPTLAADSAAELAEWGKVGTKAKADMVGILLNGGETGGLKYEGSIAKVNRVMLDYNSRSRADQFMKNFFPFWMFPSRSVPFWIQTIATHPQIISIYSKLKRLSEAQRYQAGAVTSQGKPLPSLDGYVKLPGTDMWFNPLAPFSWRYVLSITEIFDDAYYSSMSEDDDVPISAWMTKKFLETSPIYGFSVAPWITYGLSKVPGVDASALPSFPLIPEISLIPRWLIPDEIRMGDSIYSKLTKSLYPEAQFSDYLVERRILQNALQTIQNPESTPEQKSAALNDARKAIYDRQGNELWENTYKELTGYNVQGLLGEGDMGNASRSLISFFTGMYPKEFTDSMADLLALRNDVNLMKSALNNQYQSAIFDIPMDDDAAWQRYLDMNSTDEGQLYRLYTDIGWVRNDAGDLVKDPKERSKYVRLMLEEEQRQKDYYEVRAQLQKILNDELMSVDIGAPYELYGPIFDKYYDALDRLSKDERYQFSQNVSYLTNKPMSIIERETRYEWFRTLNATKPVFNPEKESFAQWEKRVDKWETMLPNISTRLLSAFTRREDIAKLYSNLRPDQKANMTKDFWQSLVAMGNSDGLDLWRVETDDVMDAMNNAWKDLYWNKYWDGPGAILTDPNGIEDRYMERYLADTEFAKNNPPPTPEELYAWIQNRYGDRFTFAEVQKWATYGDKEILSVEQRQLQQHGEEYMNRREVYRLLSWVGPYKKGEVLAVLNKELVALGEENDIILSWMKDGDVKYINNPEKIKGLIDSIKAAYAKLGVEPPTRELIAEYAKAEESNNKFKQMVQNELGMEYDRIIAIQSAYYNESDISAKAKKLWIRENREAYDVLKDYWNARRAYAKTDKLWGKYWMWTEVPEQLEGIAEQAKGLSKKPVIQPKTPVKVNVTFPSGLESRLGAEAVKAIQDAYSGKPLASYDIEYLRDFAQRHEDKNPQWAAFIEKVLKLK